MGLFAIVRDGKIEKEYFDDRLKDEYLDKYDELVLEDYSLIFKSGNLYYVDIAKNTNLEDYKNIMEVVSSIPVEEQDDMMITNHVTRYGMDDVDVFDYGHIKYVMEKHRENYTEERFNAILNNRKPIKVLDVFLRKKLDLLNEEEKDMYSKYEDFDLDTLLFDEDNELLTLNTDNSGFISIYDDCIYKTTNTMDAHSFSQKKHEKWYKENHSSSFDTPIKIHIYKKLMAIFLPIEIKDYQLNELDKIIEEVEDLCKFHNTDILIEAESFDKNGESKAKYENLGEIREMIDSKKDVKSI